jgi:DNA polymerase-3 subunit epsilon
MRQIILDTETTGLNPDLGHRIIEVACLELVDRRPTGRQLHYYVNPEREIDPGAKQVHGLTEDFLADKPLFGAIAQELSSFVEGCELLIHNAPFDIGFLEAEYKRLDGASFRPLVAKVTDTLTMARELHPGRHNSLDALCQRYGISNKHRTFHGALLDAQLLGEVFLAMTRGQESLQIGATVAQPGPEGHASAVSSLQGLASLVIEPTDEEIAAHAAMLEAMKKDAKGDTVWQQLVA